MITVKVDEIKKRVARFDKKMEKRARVIKLDLTITCKKGTNQYKVLNCVGNKLRELEVDFKKDEFFNWELVINKK